MCGDPSPPNTCSSDRGEAGSTTETCEKCVYWNEDYDATVSGQSSKYNDSTQFGALPVRFKLDTKLAGGEILISYVCKWGTVEADPPLTDVMKVAIKTSLTSTVPTAWSNKHDLRVIDPICGEKTLPIRFALTWDDAGTGASSIDVNLQKAGRRSSASANVMNLDYDDDLDDSSWTLKHEFGHVLANHDEYHYSGHSGESITLKRADGSEETLNLEPSANIMITRGNTTVKKRHLYFVEIEAQKLLRDKAGRDVTCEVV